MDITEWMAEDEKNTLCLIEDWLTTGEQEMSIKIEQNADFSKKMEKCGQEYPCAVCGRPCPDPQYMVHVDIFMNALLPDEAISEDMDLGYYPIGTNCLRKHPELKPYAVKQGAIEHPCITHKKREGSYLFVYSSNGQPKTSYFCEECAQDKNYYAFNQPLVKIVK